MQLNSLRATALLSLSLGLPCQAALSQAQANETTTATEKAPDNSVTGLPRFLLEVPEGAVLMGIEVDDFVSASSQAAFPRDPSQAAKLAKKRLVKAMRQSASAIGRQHVHVQKFFLSKWPVKNGEYQTYVDKMRAAKVDIRPPFHWWRYGCETDYESRKADIRKAFPKDPKGATLYWEREGKNLPYKVQDKDGNSIADYPVVYLTWRDANAFAASLGMRLPTEAEYMRAMRGDGKNIWPIGTNQGDTFKKELLKDLGMTGASGKIKPVGTVDAAVGPYGHQDLFGQVWQLVGDLGFDPIHDMDSFLSSWKQLQKHKLGKLCPNMPTFAGAKAIAKGGSYLSGRDPHQLMLDNRAPMRTDESFEALGMRLAKSFQPGYDYLYSLQRIQFNTNAFKKNQALALSKVVGAERYELAANGFPTSYEAVTFAPVNWLSNEGSVRLKSFLEQTQTKPLLIGALAATAKFDNGSSPGLYSVFYRKAGIPRELREAIKIGHKEVVKARKEAEKQRLLEEKRKKASGNKKASEKKASEKKASEKKKNDKKKKEKQGKARKWRMVTKQFGLTDDDVAQPKAASGDCGYVVIDGIKIPTDKDTFIMSTQGKMVSVLPSNTKQLESGEMKPGTLSIEAGEAKDKGKSIAKFHISIPLVERSAKKALYFNMNVLLDQAPPSPTTPWRLPNVK
jgi:formylglycine-generating enzyme required for sulfatase activity